MLSLSLRRAWALLEELSLTNQSQNSTNPIHGYSLYEITFVGEEAIVENGSLGDALEAIAFRQDIDVVGMDCGYLLSLPTGQVLSGKEITHWLSQHFGRKQQEELSNAQS